MDQQRGESALARLQRLELEKGRASTQVSDPESAARPAPAQRKRGVVGTVIAVVLLALGKLKFLLGGLKFLSFGKLLTTSSTMLLSLVLYAQFYGWRFAAGFLLLVLVHELGHGLAAQLQGLKVGAPVFIPFFGAFIALKERPKTPFQDFVIGAGGPLAGSAGGLLCVFVAKYLNADWSGLFFAVGYFALWLNLFNLFPVWQLDGARMTAPLGAAAWWWGFGALALVTLYSVMDHGHLQPMPLILLGLVGFRAAGATFGARKVASQATALERLQATDERAAADRLARVTDEQRSIAAGVYFGLAGTLVYLTHVLSSGLAVTPT